MEPNNSFESELDTLPLRDLVPANVSHRSQYEERSALEEPLVKRRRVFGAEESEDNNFSAIPPIVSDIAFRPVLLAGKWESSEFRMARKIIEYCINNHANITNIRYHNLLAALKINKNVKVFLQFFCEGKPLKSFSDLKKKLANISRNELLTLLEKMENFTINPEVTRKERLQREVDLQEQLKAYTGKLLAMMRFVFSESKEDLLVFHLKQLFYYSNGPENLIILEKYLEQRILFIYFNSSLSTPITNMWKLPEISADTSRVLNSTVLEYYPSTHTVVFCFGMCENFFEVTILLTPEVMKQLPNISLPDGKNNFLLKLKDWYCALSLNKYYSLSLKDVSKALSGEHTKVSQKAILETFRYASVYRVPFSHVNSKIIEHLIQWWLNKTQVDLNFSDWFKQISSKEAFSALNTVTLKLPMEQRGMLQLSLSKIYKENPRSLSRSIPEQQRINSMLLYVTVQLDQVNKLTEFIKEIIVMRRSVALFLLRNVSMKKFDQEPPPDLVQCIKEQNFLEQLVQNQKSNNFFQIRTPALRVCLLPQILRVLPCPTGPVKFVMRERAQIRNRLILCAATIYGFCLAPFFLEYFLKLGNRITVMLKNKLRTKIALSKNCRFCSAQYRLAHDQDCIKQNFRMMTNKIKQNKV